MADKEATNLAEVGIAIDHRAVLLGPKPFGGGEFAMNQGSCLCVCRESRQFSHSAAKLCFLWMPPRVLGP